MIADSQAVTRTQIRTLIDGWIQAVRSKDVAGSLAGYPSGVIAFDLLVPLRYEGLDTVKERLEQWFSSFEGPIGYEIQDVKITAGEDVAFFHGLPHVHGKKTDGNTIDMFWRTTVCLSKTDGGWVVTHSHSSVPFDMETQKAALDLTP